jgi:hypothetical protein
MTKINYNTDQWLIFNYPPGTGGKFLISCFFQFDNVAHWSGQQLTRQETVDWYINSLPGDSEIWSGREIDTPWVLPNISRAWGRGNNTTEDEFNSKMSGIESLWNQGLKIPDFWHKSQCPAWWTNAQIISIHVDDIDLYKKLLFSKLFEFKNGIMISHDQQPDIGRAINQTHKQIFQNQWLWENVSSTDEFYDKHIQKLPWHQGWDFKQPPNNDYITLSELFDIDSVYNFMLKFEAQFNQTVSKEYITAIHTAWKTATEKRFNLL